MSYDSSGNLHMESTVGPFNNVRARGIDLSMQGEIPLEAFLTGMSGYGYGWTGI